MGPFSPGFAGNAQYIDESRIDMLEIIPAQIAVLGGITCGLADVMMVQ